VAPESKPAGYSGTPLPKKLGIREGSVVALLGAPPGFERTLGALPAGVTLTRAARARAVLTLWFVTRRADLVRRAAAMAVRSEESGLWIIWPKQSSALAGDVTESAVRDAGLAAGMVDFKVCAVDATWSGLRFSRRKPR
jgi:hypothetical protein